jgi:hypothetical protein
MAFRLPPFSSKQNSQLSAQLKHPIKMTLSFGQKSVGPMSWLKISWSPSFLKIRLGLYNKKFQKCHTNYLGLSYEQLYLLVNHHRDHSSLL